ncbi:Fanconi anemia group B protein [Xenopus tropicalis]|uniref:Fanconi anemia group B protein n=1 Tax=Xenopus tropicalis TaxID=8364 RepID=A0A8J1J2H7_XENTR|nr:Fanconi anemia group B protein [Xenopus tropicalis]
METLFFKSLIAKEFVRASEKYKLLFFRKRFDRVSQTFIEQSLGQYSFPGTKSGVELVCINCVTDSRTGLNLPCVLLKTCKAGHTRTDDRWSHERSSGRHVCRHLKKKSSGATKCTLLLFHASSEVECFLKFPLDVDRLQDLQICDGPAVLWRYQEKLCYISRFTSGILTSPLSVTAIQWVGTVDGEGTIIFGTTDLSFQVADNITSGLHLDGTLQGTEFVLYSVEKQSNVPGICFLPHAYSTVLRCLQVCMIQKGNDRYETSGAAVSSKQLIWIENGTPKEVCQLPFENPCKLQVASTSRGDLLFIISFASGDVCAVQKDGFKVAATWQQVYTVLIDDFLGKGADQILLLFKYEPNSSPDLQSFKLTDCCLISVSLTLVSRDYCCQGYQVWGYLLLRKGVCKGTRFLFTTPPADMVPHPCAPLPSLHLCPLVPARLSTPAPPADMAGLLSLQELQQDLELKDRVLRSSGEALINMVQGKESAVPCADKEGLVSLWDDIKGSPCPPSTEMCPSLPDECPVERIWQRVVDDLLVIGVKLSSSAYLCCIEDLLAVLSTYLKCSLHISSPDCTLTLVKLWMIVHMQGEPVRHIPEITFSLDGTLFLWNPQSPCEGKLTIFARNKAVFLQCLCSLKSVPPPTCVLNIVKQEGTHCLAESLALSLEEELLALRSAIFTSASDVEEDLTLRSKMQKKPSSTITPLSDTKEDVERYREELLIEQEQSKLGANITIKSDQYRQLIAKVAQIQMNSDRIAGKLATL